MNIKIRESTIEDHKQAAFLLAETTGSFGIAALGLGDPNLQLKALETWFSSRGNRFSYEHTLMAESEGIPAGLLLRFSGKDLTKLELGCGREIFKIYGLFGAVKMIWRNKVLSNAKEVENDEYLIAHLAVDPHFRRQGIAEALMQRAVDETRSLGLSKLVLEVEIGNDPAIQLYQKTGFKIVNTVLFGKQAALYHCDGFYKMLMTV